MAYIKELFFHIKGTPDVEEVGWFGTTKENYIKATLGYDLGGYNMFTHKPKSRGFYMNVYPVGYGKDLAGHWEATSLFGKGWSRCIVECTRRTKKKEQEAIGLFDTNLPTIIKNYFPDMDVEMIPEAR